jgi:endonuclease YncB( thermonuclease family)
MSKFFSFINTGPDAVAVIYHFVDPDTGDRTQRTETLESKRVASSQNAQARFGLDKNLRLVDAAIQKNTGATFSLMAKNDAFGNVEDILKKSIIIDIETLGKESGSVITQMGAYDVGTGTGKMYIFTPSLIKQEELVSDRGFANRSSQRLKVDPNLSFKELKYAETASRWNSESFDDSLARVKAYDKPALDAFEHRLLVEDYFQGRYFASEENLEAHLRTNKRLGDVKTKKVLDDLRPIRTFMQALGDTMTEAEIDTLLRETRGEGHSLQKLFTSFELKKSVDMRDFLTKDMPDLLRGKVTWIANAGFESTQFGAQIDAEAFESLKALNEARLTAGKAPLESKEFFSKFAYGGYEDELNKINVGRSEPVITRNPLYGVTEGVSAWDSKPFYVTGKEYSAARSLAFETGDFTKLYDTFLRTTKAGDVRDIIDLVRMQQSTLIKEGFITTSKKPSSMSMEIQARIYGVTEAMRLGEDTTTAYNAMFQKELHIGLGDVRLSEYPVLRESLDQLEALRLVEEGGEAGRILQAEAARGEGAYFRAQVYGEIMDVLNTEATDSNGKKIDTLHDVLFRQRIAGYMTDLADSGSYEWREYAPGRRSVTQLKDVGGVTAEINVDIAISNKTKHLDVNLLFEQMQSLDEYDSADRTKIIADVKGDFSDIIDDSGRIAPASIDEFKLRAKHLSESAGNQIASIEARFHQDRPQILDSIKQRIQKRALLGAKPSRLKLPAPPRGGGSVIKKALQKHKPQLRSLKRGYLGAAGLLFGASFIPKPEKKNLLLGTKEEFIAKKSSSAGVSSEDYVNALKTRYNTIEGMSEKGIAATLRKAFTDFGSPYESPSYSMSVLRDHNLRRERERYMAAQFGARHFSAEGDIGFFLKKFVDSAFRKQMGYVRSPSVIFNGAPPIDASKYNSLSSANLTEYVMPEGSSVTVEDADTITIRDVNRSQPGLKNIIGDPGEMKIRLAGIDAPETAHQGRAAQPFAEEAKRIAAEMIHKAKEIKIISQKGDSTYGRQVALVYADGVNVNLELLKRGAAAYLPYKSKSKPPIYNQQAFETAQENAYQSKRGMWKQPYFEAYKTITDVSNQTATFNTLVNLRKVAKSGHLMSMRTLMDQAQEMGIDNQMQLELTDLGTKIGGSEKPFTPDSARNSWSKMDLQTYGSPGNSILSILDRQKHEIGNLMSTRGSLTTKDKTKVSKVAGNNVEMTKNVLAQKSYTEENKARKNIDKKLQDLKLRRLKLMESMQQNALRNQFNSPIGHHRM